MKEISFDEWYSLQNTISDLTRMSQTALVLACLSVFLLIVLCLILGFTFLTK